MALEMFSAALAEEEEELIFRKASGSSGSMLAGSAASYERSPRLSISRQCT